MEYRFWCFGVLKFLVCFSDVLSLASIAHCHIRPVSLLPPCIVRLLPLASCFFALLHLSQLTRKDLVDPVAIVAIVALRTSPT